MGVGSSEVRVQAWGFNYGASGFCYSLSMFYIPTVCQVLF